MSGGAPALTEEQIQRFSRQILLREVGGAGQAALCRTPVRVDAASAGAAEWLRAGGSPVEPRGPAQVHVQAAPVIAALPAGAVVVHGGREGALEIVFGAVDSCRACLGLSLTDLHAPPDALGELGAALAALAAQRHVLGLAPREGILRAHADGRIDSPSPLPGCEAHR